MLGVVVYTDSKGIRRRVSYTEIHFKRKYCYLIDTIANSSVAVGFSVDEGGHLLNYLKQELYLLTLNTFHNPTEINMDILLSNFSGNVIFKEIEIQREKPLGKSLNKLQEETLDTLNHNSYIYDNSFGFLQVKSIQRYGSILVETKNSVVNVVLNGERMAKDYNVTIGYNVLAYYLTNEFFNNPTSKILLTKEDIQLYLYKQTGNVFTIDFIVESLEVLK